MVNIAVWIGHGGKAFSGEDKGDTGYYVCYRRKMEVAGGNLLIRREVVDGYPGKIEYSVTEYCLSINDVVKPMEKWEGA